MTRQFINTVLITLSSLLAFACNKNEGVENNNNVSKQIRIREKGAEFLVPSSAWDRLLGIEVKHQEASQGEKTGGGHGGKSSSAVEEKSVKEDDIEKSSFLYAPISVVLKEKNRGTLKESSYRIQFPEGGGDINLSDYLSGKTGTFYIGFELSDEVSLADTHNKDNSELRNIDLSQAKVLYYGRTKKRKVGSDEIGIGCQKILEMNAKNIIGVNPEKNMIKVNTARSFASTVVGGYFLFSWMQEGVRKVSHVGFFDSDKEILFCDKITKAVSHD